MRHGALSFPRNRITVAVVLLLIVTYLCFLWLPGETRSYLVLKLGVYDRFDYRLLLATLIHVNARHIIANLTGIALLGSWLESRLGKSKYLAISILCVLSGWSFYLVRGPEKPAVGASGLFFGLLGMFWGLQGQALSALSLLGGIAWLGLAVRNPIPGPTDIHASAFLTGSLVSVAKQKISGGNPK